MKTIGHMLLLVAGLWSCSSLFAVAPSPITTQCCEIKVAGAEESDPFYKENCSYVNLTVEQCRNFLRYPAHRLGN